MSDLSTVETQQHILQVSIYLNLAVQQLIQRMVDHDQSKLQSPEKEVFAKYTPLLKTLEYGSPEYFNCLEKMKSCIEHHYQENRHHPEHFTNGIDGMTLIDLVEMLCDWKASSLRTKGGNIFNSLQTNKVRFNISEQLYQILKNTLVDLNL